MSDELLNASRDAEVVNACAPEGVDHDYRLHVTTLNGKPATVLRCVWCNAVSCGTATEPDPCIEPWHHEPLPHRTASGTTWPIGGTRDE